jgi:hypothetical protein
MLYGGAGENSLLTPSSFLCQLLEDDGPGVGEIIDPAEPIFVRLDKDFEQFASAANSNVDRFGKDVALLCPILPCLACWNADTAAVLEGDARRGDSVIDEYLKYQSKVNAKLQLPRRAPQDEAELEYVEIAMWITIRQKLFSHLYNTTDPIRQYLQQLRPAHKENEDISVQEVLRLTGLSGVRCEFTPDAKDVLPGTPPPGTVLYFFASGAEVFFVEPSRDTPDKGRVVLSMHTIYTEAIIHSKLLFKISFCQHSPTQRFTCCVTFRDRQQCQMVAQAVQSSSKAMKKQAAALVMTLLREKVVIR